MNHGVLIMPRGKQIDCSSRQEAQQIFNSTHSPEESVRLINNGREVDRKEPTEGRWAHD